MPRQKAPEVGFGLVPTGRYMGDTSGTPTGVGPVVPGDFFIDKSTLPAVWVVNVGAALSSNATLYPIYSGPGSTASTTPLSSLYTGLGVTLAGTTTPSTPISIAAGSDGQVPTYRSTASGGVLAAIPLSTFFPSQANLVAGSTVANTPITVTPSTADGRILTARSTSLPGMAWEVADSTKYTGQAILIAGTTTVSSPAATTASPTVAGTAPVFRSSVATGILWELPTSTYYSGQGRFLAGTTVASAPAITGAPSAGNTLVFRTSVATGWNPETVATGMALISSVRVDTLQTTTVATYGALATAQATSSFPVPASGIIEVSLAAFMTNTLAANECHMSFAISGTDTVAASDTTQIYFFAPFNSWETAYGATYVVTGLTPGGSDVVTAQFKSGGSGTAGFKNRIISVKG